MSYFSNLLTTTTSRYTSFRRTLLSSSSEDDSSVDDPESSHVSRVLRAYYTEKNRPFPAWLGTDPRTVAQAQKPQSSFVSSAQSSLRGHRSRSSGGNSAGGGNAGVGGLGDLWASDNNSGKPQEEPTSLRRGFAAPPGMRGADGRGGGGAPQQQAPQRQLPSQRAGSYQTQQQPNPYGTATGPGPGPGRNMSPAPPSSAGSGTSVQERLKARLGGRSAATPSPPLRERGNGGAGYEGQQGGGPSSYDDRRPYLGAGSPWSDVDDGSYGSGAGTGGQLRRGAR
ncbi:GTPase activating protein [Pseudocyphellaria aurata]|nr:GTPase activating protein [Pseudocyphellaria aurata]